MHSRAGLGCQCGCEPEEDPYVSSDSECSMSEIMDRTFDAKRMKRRLVEEGDNSIADVTGTVRMLQRTGRLCNVTVLDMLRGCHIKDPELVCSLMPTLQRFCMHVEVNTDVHGVEQPFLYDAATMQWGINTTAFAMDYRGNLQSIIQHGRNLRELRITLYGLPMDSMVEVIAVQLFEATPRLQHLELSITLMESFPSNMDVEDGITHEVGRFFAALPRWPCLQVLHLSNFMFGNCERSTEQRRRWVEHMSTLLCSCRSLKELRIVQKECQETGFVLPFVDWKQAPSSLVHLAIGPFHEAANVPYDTMLSLEGAPPLSADMVNADALPWSTFDLLCEHLMHFEISFCFYDGPFFLHNEDVPTLVRRQLQRLWDALSRQFQRKFEEATQELQADHPHIQIRYNS